MAHIMKVCLKLRIIAFISQRVLSQKYHKGNWQVTSLFTVNNWLLLTVVTCMVLGFLFHIFGIFPIRPHNGNTCARSLWHLAHRKEWRNIPATFCRGFIKLLLRIQRKKLNDKILIFSI